MRLRASVAACLAISAFTVPASAGWAVATAFVFGTSTDQKSYVSPIEGSGPYTTKLGQIVVAEDDGTTPVLLPAIAEMGIDDGTSVPGPLFGIGSAGGSNSVPVYVLTLEKSATGELLSVKAKPAQTLTLGLPVGASPQIAGAGFDHAGALYLLVHTYETINGVPAPRANVVRFAPQVGGSDRWNAAGELAGSVSGPENASLDGGDIAVMGDGTLLVSVGQLGGPSTAVPLYYRLCRSAKTPQLEPLATLPAAGNLSADGLATGTQVLAVSGDAKQSVVFPVTGGPFPMATPFLVEGSGGNGGSGGASGGVQVIDVDLAAVAPFLDTDKDGLSDAEEGACASIRSVEGAGPPDYKDADIDDDCVNDGVDVAPSGDNPTAYRRDVKKPNENTDRNCVGGAGGDGSDDGLICDRAAGALSPTCVPGCRLGVPGSGCPDGLACVPNGASSVGACQKPPMGGSGGVGGSGGLGGSGGSAGRGDVGIEGQAGASAGAPAGLGTGTSKDDDSGSCALVSGPGSRERAGIAGLGVCALALLACVRRRRR